MEEDILLRDRITLKHKILFLAFAILIVDTFSLIFDPIIYLSENQILYLMSTMAQVVAGLFGLVLAAYAIIDPKLKTEEKNNEESEESLRIIRKKYHANIIVLSILCAGTIFSCLLTLGCFEIVPNNFVSMLLNQSSAFCMGSIILFLSFGCSLLNPNALSNLNSEALEEVNNDYEQKDLQFRPFIEVYSKLESLIIKYASELIGKDTDCSDDKTNAKYKNMHTTQALRILQMNEIINEDIFLKIDELRRYRNALMHSEEHEKVNSEVYNDLQEMYRLLYAVYEVQNDVVVRNERIKELYKFGRRVSLSKREKEILKLIYSNPNITLKELSCKLSYSRTSMSHKLEGLRKSGKLVKENGKYKVLVDKSLFTDEDKS